MLQPARKKTETCYDNINVSEGHKYLRIRMQEISNQTFQISCTSDMLCSAVFSVSQKLFFVLRTIFHDSAFASCVFVSDILSTQFGNYDLLFCFGTSTACLSVLGERSLLCSSS